MKKISIFILWLLSLTCFSQIQLDFQTPKLLNYVRLNSSEVKYINVGEIQDQQVSQFSLYNLDGSIFNTIQLPPPPNSAATVEDIYWVSTSLFDNDPTTIEYLIVYHWDSIPGYAFTYNKTRVIREDGIILLDEMNAISNNGTPALIYSTEQGTKLLLQYRYADFTWYQTKAFSLPGNLPTNVKNETPLGNNLLVYPNPNAGSFFIKLDSKKEGGSDIELFTNAGKLINTYKSIDSPIQIKASGLPNGIYYLTTRLKNINSTGKVIIQK
jgi:hypothetical protein